VLEEVRALDADLPVLVSPPARRWIRAVRCSTAGDDLMIKPFSLHEFAGALRALLRRKGARLQLRAGD